MFTIKYIYPDGQEMISGPYEMITATQVDSQGNALPTDDRPRAFDLRRYLTVYAYGLRADRDRDISSLETPPGYHASMTYGPNVPPASDIPEAVKRGRLFVMNESGATVAKYEL